MVVVTSKLVTYVSEYVNPLHKGIRERSRDTGSHIPGYAHKLIQITRLIPGSLPREARSRRSQAAQACCSIRGTKALAGTPKILAILTVNHYI